MANEAPQQTFVHVLWSIAEFFLPAPKVMWMALSVATFFCNDPYLWYFSFGYYVELGMHHVVSVAVTTASVCGDRLFPDTVPVPCLDAQLFASFMCFVAVHLLADGWDSVPATKTLIVAVYCGALVLSLLTARTCTLSGIAVGVVLGALGGAGRAIAYRAILGDPRDRKVYGRLMRTLIALERDAADAGYIP